MRPESSLKKNSPGLRRQYPSRSAVLLFLTCTLFLACALTQSCHRVQAVKKAAPTLFFPAPPETARVQYLGSLSSSRDLPHHRSRFADFVLGAEPEYSDLAKPNSAVLVGNHLYVCDTVLNTVLVYDLESGGLRAFAGDAANGKIRQPNSIKVDDQGNFYIPDKLRQAVLVYGPDEQFKAAWNGGRMGKCSPVDLAIGPRELYVCDINDNEIEVWDRATGNFLRALGGKGIAPGMFHMPSHITLDTQGNLLVTDTGNFRVQKIATDGKSLAILGGHGDSLGKFAWPKGIGVDGHGRIYVADSRFYNVQIFSPDGRLLLFFGGPGPNGGFLELPNGLSVQPWPANVAWLSSRLASGFDPEYLVTVVSQQGDGFVNFFAIARETAAGQ